MIYNKHAPDETAWSMDAMNDCHNGHPQCIDKIMLSALPAARRATREEEDIDAKVLQVHRDGAAPRVCSNFLFVDRVKYVSNICVLYLAQVIVNQFQETDVLIKRSNVHNIVRKINMKVLSGKTHTEALMKHSKDKNVPTTVSVDEENRVQHLFWQLELSKNSTFRHHEVQGIDCTYKTNAYSLPLLHVVGFYLYLPNVYCSCRAYERRSIRRRRMNSLTRSTK